MSIARQYGWLRPKPPPKKFEQPKKPDPLIAAREEVKALQSKVAQKDDEIFRLRRELAKAR